MPKWITAIFVFFLSTTLLTAKALTVEDVINRHVEVMAAEMHTDMQAAITRTLTAYVREGNPVTLEGIETVSGNPCYKLRVDLSSGGAIFYLIDARSWLIIRKSVSARNQPVKEILEDSDQLLQSLSPKMKTNSPATIIKFRKIQPVTSDSQLASTSTIK